MKISLAKVAALAKSSHPVCLGRGTAGRELRTGHLIICHCVWRALKAKGISPLDHAAVKAAIGAEEEAVAARAEYFNNGPQVRIEGMAKGQPIDMWCEEIRVEVQG